MSKTKLKIRVYGDSVLRRTAVQVKAPQERHRELLSAMAQFMYEHSGVGLAAPQIGESEALIVVDIGTGLYKLINPRILRKEGVQAIEEGCLSIPGVGVKVKRAKKILVHALDLDFKPVTIEAENLLACVFQHEIDHLHGRMIIDHASFVDKMRIKKKLQGLDMRPRDEGMSKQGKKRSKLQL